MKKVLLLGALAILALPQTAIAGPDGPMPTFTMLSPQGPIVNLTVSDSVEVAPDIAYVTLSVLTTNKVKTLAMQENRKKSDAVVAVLKAAGVTDKDIETQWFNVVEDFDYTPAGKRSKKGYAVSNSVQVTVRKLDALSDLLANASSAGATDVGSPNFDVEVKTPFIEKLTRSASDKARARAEFHSRLNGYAGIRLVSVSDEVKSSSRDSGQFAATYALRSPPAEFGLKEAMSAPYIRPQAVTIGVSLYMAFEMTK